VSKQFTLGKKERLKSRKQIEQLFREGKSFALPPFRIHYVLKEMLNAQHSMFHVQFGVGVGSKNFKKAVDRNRIKRLTREAWRLQKNDLHEKLQRVEKQLNVFFIYTGKEITEYSFVFDKVNAAIQKLIKRVEQREKTKKPL